MKKLASNFIMCIAALVLVVSVTVFDAQVKAAPVVYGDASGDGKVMSNDYALIRDYVLKRISTFPSQNGLIAADVSGDGRIMSNDYALVRDFVLKVIFQFPVQNSTATPVPTATPTSVPTATPTPVPTATPVLVSKVMFDDFSYTSTSDQNLTNFKWTIRSGAGGPGIDGCSWSKNNVSFVDDSQNSGNRLMRIKATTDGKASGTIQSEVYHSRKYFEGTYAARVRFTDAPVNGPDGDLINETFFTITPLEYDMDPSYSECDFEYLSNGGWGVDRNVMWFTTWETYDPDPWTQDSFSTSIASSHNGWHTLVCTVANGEVKYYIDGVLKATHSGKYYPESLMSINFNIWFLADGILGSTESRTYEQDVDWVFHAKNTVLSPSEVNSHIQNFKNSSTKRIDTVN